MQRFTCYFCFILGQTLKIYNNNNSKTIRNHLLMFVFVIIS